MSESLTICSLGRLSTTRGGEPVNLGERKAAALLLYVACTEHPQPREVLAEMLWEGRSQSGSLANLRRALTHLRQQVGAYVTITRETVGLNTERVVWLDVAAFEELAASDTPSDLAAAADLYQGDFLSGFYVDSDTFEDWAQLERERLRLLAMEVIDRLVTYNLEAGDFSAGIGYATRLLGLDSLREETHRRLMHLLARSGQRVKALEQYKKLTSLLADELGVAPMLETIALYEQIQAGKIVQVERKAAALRTPAPPRSPEETPPTTWAPPNHNLPRQATSFVGREPEIQAIIEQLADPDCHLLTLVGPGGMGKTRLALAVAERLVRQYANGVYFVKLAPLSDPEAIVPAMAAAVGFQFYQSPDSPQQQLLNYLREREMLLVLDNFEHLLDGVDLMDAILATASGITLLATSREALNIGWEWRFEVGGMRYPQNSEGTEDDYSALRLFAERARRIQPSFSLREQRACAERVCQLVGGMPLGIELATAWLRALPCDALVAKIENSLDILTTERRDVPERQRSLRAVFESTWWQLSEEEREAFLKLSVFRGGFTPEAAEQVAGATLRIRLALLNKSLLQRDPATDRYDMHGLWQHYAAEKLSAIPEAYARNQARHCTYYAAFMEELASTVHAGHTHVALDEIDNVRLAWHYAIAQQAAPQIRQFIDAVSWLYELQGWYQDAVRLFEPAADALHSEVLSGDTGIAYGRLVGLLGWFKGRCGERAEGYRQVQASIAILRELDAHEEIALTQLLLGRLASTDTEVAAAYRLCEQSLQHLDGGSLSRIASAHIALAELANALGDHEAALQHAQLGQDLNREIDSPRGYAGALRARADTAAATGDQDAAEQRYLDSLATYQELGYRQGIVWSLHGLARLALARDEHDAAWGYFREALDIAMEVDLMPLALEALVGLAELLLRQGDWPLAAESLTLARRHPAATSATQAAAGRLLAEYQSELAPFVEDRPVGRSAQQRTSQLEALVAELLAL